MVTDQIPLWVGEDTTEALIVVLGFVLSSIIDVRRSKWWRASKSLIVGACRNTCKINNNHKGGRRKGQTIWGCCFGVAFGDSFTGKKGKAKSVVVVRLVV